MQNQLLTETQAADRLGLKPETLRRWRWSGEGPGFVKIGRSVRYEPEVIDTLIEQGRRTSTSDTGSAT